MNSKKDKDLDNFNAWAEKNPPKKTDLKKLVEGLKFDNGKPRVDLISSKAIIEMGKVLGFGAEKYEEHNWRKGIAWSRCAAAALRHLYAWLDGETIDPESKLNHLAHAMVNLSFLLEYSETRKEFDDRYEGTSNKE